jgi:hypothetical protein
MMIAAAISPGMAQANAAMNARHPGNAPRGYLRLTATSQAATINNRPVTIPGMTPARNRSASEILTPAAAT